MATTSTLPSLSSLGCRSFGRGLLVRAHPHWTIGERAMYSSAPRRKSSNQGLPNQNLHAALRSAANPRASKTASHRDSSPKSSGGRGTPSNAGQRSNQAQSQNLNSSGQGGAPHQLATNARAGTNRVPSQVGAQRMRKANVSCREYKSAARKWIASIIALPIFIVTSYFLLDRRMSPPNPVCCVAARIE